MPAARLTVALLLIVLPACRGMDKVEPKSIESLYSEAVAAAENREQLRQSIHTMSEERIRNRNLMGGSDGEIHSISDPNALQIALSASSEADDESVEQGGEADAKRISEAFEETDIREAIQILASLAEVSVIIDDTIGGVTSAIIEDETFDEALEKILLPIGLVYAKQDGRYIIAPPDPDSPLFDYVSTRIQYLPLHHKPATLTTLLPPRFKPYLHSLPDRNLIVIDAPHEIGQDILKRIQELDQPVPQVELEAIVCVVSPDKGFRFGLDWGHVVGVNGVNSLRAGLTGLTFSGSASPQGISDSFSDFAVTSAFVRLLAQEGYISIRAAPRVTARDGEKALISINRETFFSLQPTDSNIFFRQDVQKVEAGISLEITPSVRGDMIAVNIGKAEVSEDIRSSDPRAELTSNPYPIINRRLVSTNVNVRNGHTIVIGGLVQRQTVDRINRIPGLSRIPLLGKMFQTIEKQEQDAEVAIFISPRIVPCESAISSGNVTVLNDATGFDGTPYVPQEP